MRLKRDKVALAGGAVLIFLILVAIFAPLIVKFLGDPPNEFHQELIDTAGGTLAPIGPLGGMSWDHLMGIEPVNGRDIFSRIVYGTRISLLIAFLATMLSVLIGTTLGIVAGKRMAMIFQDPLSAMNPYYTVGHQIIEAYRVHNPVNKKVARKHAIDMLG